MSHSGVSVRAMSQKWSECESKKKRVRVNRNNFMTSGKHDKGIYSFKIFEISIITIRITYHQIRLDYGR